MTKIILKNLWKILQWLKGNTNKYWKNANSFISLKGYSFLKFYRTFKHKSLEQKVIIYVLEDICKEMYIVMGSKDSHYEISRPLFLHGLKSKDLCKNWNSIKTVKHKFDNLEKFVRQHENVRLCNACYLSPSLTQKDKNAAFLLAYPRTDDSWTNKNHAKAKKISQLLKSTQRTH